MVRTKTVHWLACTAMNKTGQLLTCNSYMGFKRERERESVCVSVPCARACVCGCTRSYPLSAKQRLTTSLISSHSAIWSKLPESVVSMHVWLIYLATIRQAIGEHVWHFCKPRFRALLILLLLGCRKTKPAWCVHMIHTHTQTYVRTRTHTHTRTHTLHTRTDYTLVTHYHSQVPLTHTHTHTHEHPHPTHNTLTDAHALANLYTLWRIKTSTLFTAPVTSSAHI